MENITRTSYLQFVLVPRLNSDKRTTYKYTIHSTHDETFLGNIEWKTGWRRYTFHPSVNSIFDASCLNEIYDFLNTLMRQRANSREMYHDL